MSGLKTCSSALIGILFALTAYADVILPGGGPSRPHRAWIELYADRLPHGMVLIFLDENGNLLEKAHEKEALRINRSGTVYAVRENRLSAPFSLKTNKARLYNLRTVTDDEIPSNYGRPNPMIMHCDTLSAGAGKYKLDCHDLPVPSK